MRSQVGGRRSEVRRGVRLVVVCGLWSVVCASAGAAELKIGYVDVAKVFDGYQRTRSFDATLEKKGKEKETELQGRMDELKKMRQNLELLNTDAREAKTKEVEEKTEELQRFRNNAARDLSRERDKVASGLLKEIQSAIEDYAKANGFSLILDARSALYGQDALNVTDEVLASLNKRAAPPAR